MSRVFAIPGIFFLFAAFVLSILASISLPYLPALDVTRTKYGDILALDNSSVAITELRFGIWSACSYNQNEDRTCQKSGLAYDVTVGTGENDTLVTIGSSWTRGLVVLPVATGITLIAFCLSLSQHLLVTLLASLVSFLAALMHLIAFAIQIALFARVKNEMDDLDIGASTKPGPGFWLTFVSLLLCLLAGCTVCFGRRRDRARTRSASAVPREKVGVTQPARPGFFSRFRRTPGAV